MKFSKSFRIIVLIHLYFFFPFILYMIHTVGVSRVARYRVSPSGGYIKGGRACLHVRASEGGRGASKHVRKSMHRESGYCYTTLIKSSAMKPLRCEHVPTFVRGGYGGSKMVDFCHSFFHLCRPTCCPHEAKADRGAEERLQERSPTASCY